MSDKMIKLASPTNPGINPPKVKFEPKAAKASTPNAPIKTDGFTRSDKVKDEVKAEIKTEEESPLSQILKDPKLRQTIEEIIGTPKRKDYETMPNLGNEPSKIIPIPPANLDEKPKIEPL